MCDRVYVEIEFATRDLDIVQETFLPIGWRAAGWQFDYVDEGKDGTMRVGCDEMKHGAEREMEELQKVGIPFLLTHGAGFDYAAGEAAFDGKTFSRVDTLHGEIVVRFIVEQGAVTEHDLRSVHEFLATRKSAESAIAKRAAQKSLGLEEIDGIASDRERS